MKKALTYVALITLTGYAMADDTTLEPGLYRMSNITEISMGDMQMPGRSEQVEECLTAQDIAEGPPMGDLAEESGGQCETVKDVFADGVVDIEMACQFDGGAGTMMIEGTYDENEFVINSRMQMSMQGTQMKMVHKSTGERVGGC